MFEFSSDSAARVVVVVTSALVVQLPCPAAGSAPALHRGVVLVRTVAGAIIRAYLNHQVSPVPKPTDVPAGPALPRPSDQATAAFALANNVFP